MSKLSELTKRLIGQHSPFGVTDPSTGTIVVYENTSDAYLDVIQKMFSDYPRGYIDIPLFVAKHTSTSLPDAVRKCRGREIALCVLSDVEDSQRVNKLRQVMQLIICKHCEWSEPAFKAALLEFDKTMIRANVNAKIQNGNLFNFLNK